LEPGEQEEMNVFPTRILLATDASEEARLATQTAVELAYKTGSELHVVHVGETSVPPFYTRIRAEAERKGRKELDEQVRGIEGSGGKVAEAHLRVGEPEKEILLLAQELETGLVVMGARGKNPVQRYLVGDVAESVFRHAHCPVLVVRREEQSIR
jgi:nucleotide-binding universal stress UspA family protein